MSTIIDESAEHTHSYTSCPLICIISIRLAKYARKHTVYSPCTAAAALDNTFQRGLPTSISEPGPHSRPESHSGKLDEDHARGAAGELG